ncbi:MAG: hypothetical protein ACI4N3_04615 [Alphaproteobacteria bacterium]
MKIKKYIFLLPLILTGCLSSNGGGTYSPGSHSPRDPNNNGNSNKPSSDGSTLTTFINTEKFKNDIIASNNSNITRAFETAKITINETNINIATKALQTNLSETDYISSKITKLNDAISSYENYVGKLNKFDNSQNFYIPLYYDGKYTPKQAEESPDSFAARLYQIVQNRYSNYETESKDQYISQTLYFWATDIKNILESDIILDGSKDTIETQFLTLYNQLKDSIDTADTEYNTAKGELLSKIQAIDSSITDFPLSLETLINYYKLEQSILSAIGSVDYINPPTATTTDYTAKSIYDTGDKKSVKFVYDEDTKDYSLVLTDIGTGTNHKENRTVKFKANDFISNSGYYKAEKKQVDGEQQISSTYLPNLKSYITAGGTFDVSARKNNATNTIKKVINNFSPTEAEINNFNRWFGTTLTKDYTQADINSDINSSAQLALKILEKADSNFDITKTNTITDVVKLGGKSLNLSYSDFGLWTIKGATEYSGDKDLINAKKDTDAKSSYYYIDNPFYSGLDEFKAGFKSNSNEEINSTTRFTGKTIAVASKGDVRNDLTGDAVLEIKNVNAIGSLKLSFDKWYNFIFSDIDFSNKDGFSLNDTIVKSEGSYPNAPITITGSDGDLKGNLSGNLYGPNLTTPIEGAGSYNITAGNGFKVDGAFGVKK